jgi:hypothetical protein
MYAVRELAASSNSRKEEWLQLADLIDGGAASRTVVGNRQVKFR